MRNTTMPVSKSDVLSKVPKSNAGRISTFDRSHRYLTAIDASYLYPVYVDEVYPGDIFKQTGRHLNRLLTPVKPFMDNLKAKYFYFYCPSRLVWNNFKKFMGERRRPEESITDQYQVPMLNSGNDGIAVGSIFDYAGIPPLVPNLEFSALPFRAINLIYDEWFRDENLCDWLNVGGSDSNGQYDIDSEFGDTDQLSNYNLFKVCKSPDYFTSGLPFQQYGIAQSVSLGQNCPVIGNGMSLGFTGPLDGNYNNKVDAGLAVNYNTQMSGFNNSLFMTPKALNVDVSAQTGNTNFSPLSYLRGSNNSNMAVGAALGISTDPANSGLIADLTSATGFTIADLRTSMQLQALKELTARMGHRYKEIIYGEFNVIVSDSTLDRPEFLGSYSVYFNTVPVPSTAETTDNPQGNLAAYSFTPNTENYGYTKAFEEHGYVICLAAVTTDQTYQQGLNKMYSRKNKYDFYTPLLADISEQQVKMKEILAQGASVLSADGVTPVDETTFNYQEAWAELRYKPNMITGRMRSQSPLSLDIWHLGSEFTATVLDGVNVGVPFNSDFIEDNTEANLDRVIADNSDEPQIFSDNYFTLRCTRELPIYSVPAYFMGRL